MMHKNRFRKHLSIKGLLATCRNNFDEIIDPKKERTTISLSECLMSGLALFGLKYPSLLQFDQALDEEVIRKNLNTLYGVKKAPCDTYFRERLDEVVAKNLRKPFKSIIAKVQRSKELEKFRFIDNSYLVSVDGTGYFSSKSIHCDQCCEKHHRNGTTTYYHQILGAVIVHPDIKPVLPLTPEPILKQDGSTKNDCERNAAKRLLSDLRREHPHMKLTIIEDGLASNTPHINTLREFDMNFILGVKENDHRFLFDWVNKNDATFFEYTDEKGTHFRFRFINQAPLNKSNLDCKINFLECWETKKNGKVQHFSWVTDFILTEENVYQIMRGGRARWKIENETFNTLKNQGYHFEHNFGHGKKHLSSVMAHLMLLAFLIDQVQALSCVRFQESVKACLSKKTFWKKLYVLFVGVKVCSWDDAYDALTFGYDKPLLIPNTS